MVKIDFKEYLSRYEAGQLVLAARSPMADCARAKYLIASSDDEEKKLSGRLDFYFKACSLIEDYPKCRQMIINGVERYERTGIEFKVCYNRIESLDGLPPEDIPPIVLHFPD